MPSLLRSGRLLRRMGPALLFLLLLLGSAATAQTLTTLRGSVLDSVSHRPLPGVTIRLEGRPTEGATTDGWAASASAG